MTKYFLRDSEIDENSPVLSWPDYSIYILNAIDVGRVIRMLAEETDGDVGVRFDSDDDGNIVYTVSGIVDDISLIQRVQQKCVDQDLEVQFAYHS